MATTCHGTSTSASDVRFKRNVTSITDALEVARRARAVTFSFQTDAFPERRFPKHAQAGVVAQELEAVLPGVGLYGRPRVQSVAYERIGLRARRGGAGRGGAVAARHARSRAKDARAYT